MACFSASNRKDYLCISRPKVILKSITIQAQDTISYLLDAAALKCIV